MRNLGPLKIAANEEMKRKKFDGVRLAQELGTLNVPAVSSLHQPIDVFWTCDDEVCAGDLKTVEDFIASYLDGRLHDQVTAMQSMGCRFAFILIEGDSWSQDGGHTVGDPRYNTWTWDQFDVAIGTRQMRGHPCPEASAASQPSVISSTVLCRRHPEQNGKQKRPLLTAS